MDHYHVFDLVGLNLLGSQDRLLYRETIATYGVWGYLESESTALTGHFVFTGGGHGGVYVNIRDLNTIQKIAPIAMQIAWEVRDTEFDAVVGTPHGADTLAVLVAYYYAQFTTRSIEILKPLKDGKDERGEDILTWYKDHGERVKGARILQVEDVINSAKSVRGTFNFILEANGHVVTVVAVCNRISDKNPGLEVLKEESGAERFFALTDVEVANYAVDMSKDPRDQCPQCKDGVKIDTRVGHGKVFLADIKNVYPDLYEKLA